MKTKPEPGEKETRDEETKAADSMLATGAGVAAIGAVSLVVGGAICPACVVAAPALLAIGAVRRLRTRRRAKPDRAT
jgi:hypothetical protein